MRGGGGAAASEVFLEEVSSELLAWKNRKNFEMQSWGTPDEEPVGAKTALRKALSKFELCKQLVR